MVSFIGIFEVMLFLLHVILLTRVIFSFK